MPQDRLVERPLPPNYGENISLQERKAMVLPCLKCVGWGYLEGFGGRKIPCDECDGTGKA